MIFYRWMWLTLIILMCCSENTVEETEDRVSAPPLPPKMRLHRSDVPDDLWGPDALTETDGIYIEWEPNMAAHLAGYRIYRATDGTDGYERIDRVPETITFYEDTPVRLETQHCYRVTAVDEAGNESRMSETACYTLMRKALLTSPPNQALLDGPPAFRWLGLGETGVYTLRVFVNTGDTAETFREIWHVETTDFEQFEVVFNQDGRAIEPLAPSREYRWRVDFEAQPMVGSESNWHFFQVRR